MSCMVRQKHEIRCRMCSCKFKDTNLPHLVLRYNAHDCKKMMEKRLSGLRSGHTTG